MKKLAGWLVLGGIVILLIALMIFSNIAPVDHSQAVWDKRATIGNLDARNYYILYTDLACPYCSVFSREIMNHKEEFENDYIRDKDILYEVRVTDTLYEHGEGQIQMSRDSAEAVYCAKEEDKFWEYYYGALAALWRDYHSKGIGVSKMAEPIRGMPDDYWLQIGKSIGLSEKFENCVVSHEKLDEVKEATARAWKQMQGGLPYFRFGNFITSGFSDSWDWEYVKKYLDAGLKR
ncbi:thioredoxin domain-containing protein [Candidatus Saccharibacteria bacterium]|nr:thioredoxin domain-containing protein [Candidatus Saccharibacteria bacterium]